MNMGFGATQSEPAMEPCRHRGDWDRSVINGIVLLMCGECAYTLVLAEHLASGRLYWEEVPLEGDGRLADVDEDVQPVREDEGEQRVPPALSQHRRSSRRVQVMQVQGSEGGVSGQEEESKPRSEPGDYEVLQRVQAGEVDE